MSTRSNSAPSATNFCFYFFIFFLHSFFISLSSSSIPLSFFFITSSFKPKISKQIQKN
jgi:hypothetical protein